MKVNRIIEDSSSNGPLKRFTIWFQGCSIRCKGCGNVDTWDFNKGKEISLDEIVNDFKFSGSEGLTLTGGEPLDQYKDVLALVKAMFPITSIMLCSGREYEQIEKDFSEVLKYIDILVSDPYIQEQHSDKLLWKGSSNQKLHFITERGKSLATVNSNLCEIRINKHTGEIITTGFSIPD